MSAVGLAGVRLVRALARWLLALYPAEFRRTYGRAFPDVAEDRWCRECAASGPVRATLGTIRLLLMDTAKAVIAGLPRSRRERRLPSGPSMFDRVTRHLRSAVGLLVRSPLVTAVATLSLAIGIGANVAVFTTANTLLFAKTRGVADTDRLVDIGRSIRGSGFDTVGYPTFADLRDHTTVFSGVYAVRFEPRAVGLGAPDGAERVYAQEVTGNYFDVLGVQPVAGSLLHGSDERLGTPLRRIVLSYGFWRRRFNADRSIVGQEIVLNGDRFEVGGVASEGFQGTTVLAPDLWIPLTAYAQGTPSEDLLRSRESCWLVLGARLKAGVSIAHAQVETNAFQQGLAAAYPGVYKDVGLVVAKSSRVPGGADQFVLPLMTVLMGLTGLVLLVTCANLGSLLMARAAARTRDVAVRLALGASRRSLIVMFLTEAVVLFAPGAIAALLVAQGLTQLLGSLVRQLPVPVAADLAVDWRVLGFAGALSLVTALATGLVPAWQNVRADVVPDLKADASAPRRQRARSVFVASQVASCLLLMVVAGLLARALGAAMRTDPGFQVDGIDVASVDLVLGGYAKARTAGITEQLRARLAAMPGVESVSIAAIVPLTDAGLSLGELRRVGDPASAHLVNADWNVVSPEFLPDLRLSILRGRNFSVADRPGGPLVAIVNERLARELWPGREAVGHVLEDGDFQPGREKTVTRLTVIGVVKDAKYRGLGESPRQFIYVPLGQNPWTSVHLFIRRSDQLAASVSLGPAVRQALREVDRNVPLIEMRSFRQSADLGLLPERLAASIAGSLGVVALVLSVVGIYGITAFSVANRTREIGVRIALGASRARVVRMVLRQALRLALVGGLIGLVSAFIVTRVLTDLLFGVSPVDPLAIGVTTVVLLASVVAAAYLPARRAASVNPVDALRTS